MLCLIQIVCCKMKRGSLYRICRSDRQRSFLIGTGYGKPPYTGYGTGILGIQVRIKHFIYRRGIFTNPCKVFSVPHSLNRAVSIPCNIFVSFRQLHYRTDTDISAKRGSCCIHACVNRHRAASIHRIYHCLYQRSLSRRYQRDRNHSLSLIIFRNPDLSCCNTVVYALPIAVSPVVICKPPPIIRNRPCYKQRFSIVNVVLDGACCLINLETELCAGYTICGIPFLYSHTCRYGLLYLSYFCRECELLICNLMAGLCPKRIFFQLYGKIQEILRACFFRCRQAVLVRHGNRFRLSSCNVCIRNIAAANHLTIFQHFPFYIELIQVQEVVFIININFTAQKLYVGRVKPYALILIFYFVKFWLYVAIRRNNSVYTEGIVIRTFAAVAAVPIEMTGRLVCIQRFMCRLFCKVIIWLAFFIYGNFRKVRP